MTTSVTGYTVEKSQEIWDDTVVSATLSPDGNLILHMHDGGQINAGPLADNLQKISRSIVTIGAFDNPGEDVIIPVWYTGTSNPKLPNPASLPGSSAWATSWTPDAKYLTVATSASPYITTYKRSGDTFTKLSNPATLPTSAAIDVAWSPQGRFLAVATNAAPFLGIYTRLGDTLTRIADPEASGSINEGVSWSPDSRYLAVACSALPYVKIYKRDGSTFTRLSNPADFPAGAGKAVAWSPNSKYLAVAHTGSPFITVYKRTGDTFTKLANPPSLPSGNATGVSWSPDGSEFVVSTGSMPPLAFYKRTGDVLSDGENVITSPSLQGQAVEWSPDGKFVALSHDQDLGSGNYRVSFMYLTEVSGDIGWMPIGNQPSLLPGTPRKLDWSPDGFYLAVGHINSPYVSIFKSALGQVTPPIAPIELSP